MRYSIFSVFTTVDASRHASSLEREQEYGCRKLNNVLLWIGSAEKHILVYAMFRIFSPFYLVGLL